MNLYWVTDNDDYGAYVFAESRNKARMMMVHHFDDEEYIDLRAYLKAKDVGGDSRVVECEEEKGYDRVLACGCRYATEEEWERHYDI